VGISELPLGNPGTKSHLDVALVEKRRVYYKGEGGAFPRVQAMVNLVCSNCPWLILAPKVMQLCINHFVLVLCMSMWVIEACHLFLIPSRSSNMPLYPSIVLRARERAPIPYSSTIFSLGLTFESLKDLGVHQLTCPTTYIFHLFFVHFFTSYVLPLACLILLLIIFHIVSVDIPLTV
jgi:hypothetical protein